MTQSWLRDERADAASGRILDAAGRLFATHGVVGTSVAMVAREAGCSRATLYRYFDNRRALHLAYVDRESRRIGRGVDDELRGVTDPRHRVVEAMLASVRAVRADATMAAWFSLGDAGAAAEVAASSDVIAALGSSVVATGGDGGVDAVRQGRWLVRIIVSLLTVPGVDEDDERAMIEDFVLPGLMLSATRSG